MIGRNRDIDRERNIAGPSLPIRKRFRSADYHIDDNDENDMLRLSLSSTHHSTTPPPPQLPFIEVPHFSKPPELVPPAPQNHAPRRRVRRNPRRTRVLGKSETIEADYPWSGNYRGSVCSLDSLLSQKITSISGDVQCKRCDRKFKVEYDLEQKFNEVSEYIKQHKISMHHRAPAIWMSPPLLNCRFCNQENIVKPVIAEKKRSINWLFLLLGQMLGCCTLEQLKYLCKHTNNHRTGAKDRVLFLAYLALCKQVHPSGPFEI